VIDTESFGALLRQYRLAASLSQEALAERARLSVTAVAALERGRRTAPRPTSVLLLADALGLSPTERANLVEAAANAREVPPTTRSALEGTASRRHNLPAELSSFIGREEHTSQVAHLLENARLVTLTGAGGIGKSRLALRAAGSSLERFPDGVWMIDLLPLHDSSVLASDVAHALGVHEAGRPALDSLVDALRPRHALLVLDNAEHLVEACADLAHRLLVSAAGLRLLVTGRQPLGIAGETIWRVPPLAIPRSDERAQLDVLLRCESVQLFVDRAQAADATFRLTESNAAAVAEICARLEGIPLAIQLAAAWVGTLAVGQIVDRLDDCFRLLTHGSRTAPTRQQTLQATLDWSHDQLTEAEQRLFRRLAIFAGAWTLEAAETVCAFDGLVVEEVLDVLARLVDKSLVAVEPRQEARRYRLLQPVSQYARRKLADSGEVGELRERHAAYYLALVEQAAPELTGPKQVAWLDRLEAEHSDLRAVLDWQHRQGDPEWRGLRLASAVWRFWWLRSFFGEGRAELRGLLDRAGDAPPPRIRARALLALGELAFRQGDMQAARAPLEYARDLFWQAQDDLGVALTLRSLGRLALDEGDHIAARTLLEEDLRIERELGHRGGLPWPLTYLAWLATFDARFAEARALLSEALRLCRELGDREGIGRQLFSLGHVALETGQLRDARAQFAESLTIFAALDYKYGIAYVLEGLADVAALEGESQRALWLGGAAAALRESTGAAASAEFRARHAARQSVARKALGTRAAQHAWDAGRALAPSQVVAAALTEPSLPATLVAGARHDPLTRREREVVALLARGSSNRQIAAALVIGERTVEMHVGHILAKLGLSSRTQVAVWVVEHADQR
jgi:predicted ATPase/DNA-binding CsgD family transcriptional regulator/DNA-binding XRE family transcriptional regulator